MTHREVDYAGKTDADALADLRDWLGETRYNQLIEAWKPFIQRGMGYDGFATGMSFAGVSGRPVQAFYDLIKSQMETVK